MLVVVATLPGKPAKRDEIEAALIAAAKASRAEEGCTGYAFHRDLENPDSYVSVETWRDQAAVDAHFQSPHVAVLMGLAGELLDGAPAIVTYETTAPLG